MRRFGGGRREHAHRAARLDLVLKPLKVGFGAPGGAELLRRPDVPDEAELAGAMRAAVRGWRVLRSAFKRSRKHRSIHGGGRFHVSACAHQRVLGCSTSRRGEALHALDGGEMKAMWQNWITAAGRAGWPGRQIGIIAALQA
jgi:hypothetical protein